MAGPAIEGRGLCVRFPDRSGKMIPVLRDGDIAVSPGEVLGLIGPNGSGKTTLLRRMAGFVPGEGEVLLAGRPMEAYSRRQIAQKLAFIHQKTQVPFAFSARKIAELGRAPYLRPWDAPGKHDHAIVESALERCGCLAFAQRPVTELSGGELKRVMLAQALAQEPEVLLADEPASGMDIAQSHRTFALLEELAKQGCAVIVVIHELPLAARYCTRLALMGTGRLLAQGPARKVLTAANLEAAYDMAVTGYTDPAGEWNYYVKRTKSPKEKR